MVIKILSELEERVDELSENFNRKIKDIKKNQSKLKNSIIEIKKYSREYKQQVRGRRRLNQQSGRKDNGKHPS